MTTPPPTTPTGAASLGDPYLPGSGNGGYRVRHYDLDLDYRIATNRLTATAGLHAEATATLSRLSLDLAGLRVDKVTIDGRRIDRYSQRGRKLQLTPATPITAGSDFTVDVRYSGSPTPVRGDWGEVGWEELTDGVIVAGQPDGAPSWFPCNDHPSNKASYRISVTTGSPYTVLANGRLVDRKVRGSRTTWVFDQPEPMATYLASIQIGRYELQTLGDHPVRQQAALPARLRRLFATDFARQTAMMTAFERLFGPYPFAEYTVVVTDDELEIPLEAQGMSVFGANHLDGHRGSERLLAHELAHQWFGNSLTIERWQDIWLHEGFACYAEWLWSQESGGPSTDSLARKAWRRLASLPQDLVIADPGPRLMFDDWVYKRGALTLHALRLAVGDPGFFALLRAWVSAHQHGHVSTEAFVRFAASTEPTFRAEIGAVLSDWLFTTALPHLPGAPEPWR
ncbi:MAG TPA: M1 family metallopeptidase [Kineosporiaceae bacterium]|nr:M1 family metallopeptidase [Kineosporiaceae bacterium]